MNIEITEGSNFNFIPRYENMSRRDWEILRECYMRSEERYVGIVNGCIACMWGLIPPSLMSDRAYIWLFHNHLVEEHKFAFIRHSQRQMERMLKIYPEIHGDCLVSNETARNWLRWLGAKFSSQNGAFIPFTIKAKAYG